MIPEVFITTPVLSAKQSEEGQDTGEYDSIALIVCLVVVLVPPVILLVTCILVLCHRSFIERKGRRSSTSSGSDTDSVFLSQISDSAPMVDMSNINQSMNITDGDAGDVTVGLLQSNSVMIVCEDNTNQSEHQKEVLGSDVSCDICESRFPGVTPSVTLTPVVRRYGGESGETEILLPGEDFMARDTNSVCSLQDSLSEPTFKVAVL